MRVYLIYMQFEIKINSLVCICVEVVYLCIDQNEYGVEIFHAHSSFYAQENRGICGVMLESNVGEMWEFM
jgi:hypothetical protein